MYERSYIAPVHPTRQSGAWTHAPDRCVARTRRISFTLVRKTASKPEKAERKPVGWRAREWRRMLDEGVYGNQSELARGEGVSTAAVSIALGKLRR